MFAVGGLLSTGGELLGAAQSGAQVAASAAHALGEVAQPYVRAPSRDEIVTMGTAAVTLGLAAYMGNYPHHLPLYVGSNFYSAASVLGRYARGVTRSFLGPQITSSLGYGLMNAASYQVGRSAVKAIVGAPAKSSSRLASVKAPRVLGTSVRFTRNAHTVFRSVGDIINMPRRSLKSRVALSSRKAKRNVSKKTTAARAARRAAAPPLARIEQGYMRNEGWIKMRSQKFWDVNSVSHVYTTKLPTFLIPLNRFADMCAIPSLTYSATTVLQSARVKSNVLISRVCADFSIYWPCYIIDAEVLGSFIPIDSHVLIQLLLDTQANGSWTQGTGQAGSPFVDDSIDSGGGVFGSGLTYPPNLQNVGRWFVLAERVIDFRAIFSVGVTGGVMRAYFAGGQEHACFDVPFDSGLLMEYDVDINDGGIATRRTNNLVWCITVPDWNSTAQLPPEITLNWSRTYFEDV